MLDFSFEEVMRLSNIQRWGIIEMSRSQSVAEHSYNVTMISDQIIENIVEDHPYYENFRRSAIMWALHHDLPELCTGDIPTPVKQHVALDEFDENNFPVYCKFKRYLPEEVRAIVKAADLIDALQFAEKFCVDSRKEAIIADMSKNLAAHLRKQENILVFQAVSSLYPLPWSREIE